MIANQVHVIIARMRTPLLVVSFQIPRDHGVWEFQNENNSYQLVYGGARK